MNDSVERRFKSRSRTSLQAKPSLWSHTGQVINDIVADAPLTCVISRSLMAIYLALALWLIWQLFPVSGFAASYSHVARMQGEATLNNYFANFEGNSECGIRAAELYIFPHQDNRGFYEYGTFCQSRRLLLKALSEGGRIGFDAPYGSRDCAYRWFHPTEICNILTRFDSLVFVGDESLLPIYGGLNILLRQDLALGALDPTSMSSDLQAQCHCNNQYIKQECWDHFIKDSDRFTNTDAGTLVPPYACTRPHHAFLQLSRPSLDSSTLAKFQQLVSHAPRSAYRPIPIVTSISPSTFTSAEASSILLSILKTADDSARNTPMLWVGPTAAGHVEIKGRKGNQEIWDFDHRLAQAAMNNDIETLGMWNLTVQAGSWDGVRFDERVGIVQAMMVINWLSRLESS